MLGNLLQISATGEELGRAKALRIRYEPYFPPRKWAKREFISATLEILGARDKREATRILKRALIRLKPKIEALQASRG
ncbi:hypothetical protein HYS54_05300 [Candidatus Micrarchaeota archaeon]|nr:hypothetical protein [Candidatus Micrarchaeota archaeon]